MKKQGFTIIELIFVIVVLGVIGSITASVIARLFESYIIQRSILKTELTIQNFYDTMDNYISNSISQSISMREGEFSADDAGLKDRYKPIYQVETRSDGNMTDSKKPRALLWISKDIQSLQGMWDDDAHFQKPGYNTVADIESSEKHSIYSPNLNTDIGIIEKIVTAYKTGQESSYDYDVAIFFPYGNLDGTQYDRFWKKEASSIFLIVEFVNRTSLDIFQITTADDNYKPKEIGDVFNLSSMASGIYYDKAKDKDSGSIRFVWNFVPWKASTNRKFSQFVGKRQEHDFLMLEHVTKFQVWSESGGAIIRMFLCVGDPRLRRFVKPDFEVCKESVILK